MIIKLNKNSNPLLATLEGDESLGFALTTLATGAIMRRLIKRYGKKAAMAMFKRLRARRQARVQARRNKVR